MVDRERSTVVLRQAPPAPPAPGAPPAPPPDEDELLLLLLLDDALLLALDDALLALDELDPLPPHASRGLQSSQAHDSRYGTHDPL